MRVLLSMGLFITLLGAQERQVVNIREQGPFEKGSAERKTFIMVGASVVRPPRVLKRDLEYPKLGKELKVAKVEIVVTLSLGKDGKVTEIVTRKSDHSIFTEHTKKSARNWVYEPILLNGEPIPYDMHVEITFLLYNSIEN